MSTVTYEIPKEQAEQIDALARRTQLPVTDVFGLMVELLAMGLDATPPHQTAVSALQIADALKIAHKPDIVVEPPQNRYHEATVDAINRMAAARAAARDTPEGVAAALAREQARAAGIGFGLMKGQILVDSVECQNELRDPW